MAKTKISEYSTTAGSNTDIDSTDINEGCAPSGINNAIRSLMAHLAVDYNATQAYTTTATAAGTTTLTASSTLLQFFTGSTTQTVVLPVVTTLSTGQRYEIHNNSSGAITVNSSGSNLVATVPAGVTTVITCILITGTTAASWDADIQGFTTTLPVAQGGTGAATLASANIAVTNATNTFSAVQTFNSSNLKLAGSTSGTSVINAQATAGTTVMTLPTITSTLGYLNLPAVGTKTASYTLATTDVGKYVQLGTSGTIVIPTTTFAEGDAISVFNNTTGAITITCSATTTYIAGTDTIKTSVSLATRGVMTVLFISSSLCVITGNVS